MTLPVAFLTALIVGAILTLVVRNLAHRFGWYDQVRNSRKIHQRPIPRLGGLAIVAGFFAPLAALLVVDSSVGQSFSAQPRVVAGLFGGGLAIAALGLYDDFRGADARKKLLVQLSVAIALYVLGFRISSIANPFGSPMELGWFALPFTVFWIVGVINAMNLIDGLDGLAGGVAFIAIVTNFILAFARGETLMCLMMAALGGAVLGFLVFNFNPASIFMGDTGSMFLGFVLAAVSVRTSQKAGTAVALLVPVIALGLPIMDTLLAMVRRTAFGRPMFSADKEHIHHRLMSRLLLSHRRAVLFLYGICCLFAATALALSYANSSQSVILLVGIGLVVTALMRKLGYLNLREGPRVQMARRRNMELRTIVKACTEAIAKAEDPQGIWDAVRPLAEALDAARLELQFFGPSGETEEGVGYQVRRPSRAGVPLELRLDLESRDERFGALLIAWRDGRLEVNRDEELALELVADAAAKAARTLGAGLLPSNVVPLRK